MKNEHFLENAQLQSSFSQAVWKIWQSKYAHLKELNDLCRMGIVKWIRIILLSHLEKHLFFFCHFMLSLVLYHILSICGMAAFYGLTDRECSQLFRSVLNTW